MDKAAKSMAHMYVWDAVVAILEGSTDPGRECAAAQKAVGRVIRICMQEQQRCLRNYDKEAARIRAR
jgi:chemotaxis response regulator CheB